MKGPYEQLHIYEVEGLLAEFPEAWPEAWEDMGFIGCWEEAGYSFLFFSTPREKAVETHLEALGTGRIRSTTSMPYEDWEAGCPLRPYQSGTLWITPPWIPPPERVKPSDLITLNPGVCFGSGFHASTNICLELLGRIYEKDCPRTVLDLGTGAGILAIAAARLGAEWVTAVDLQPLACKTAAENVKLNGLEAIVRVECGDAADYVAPKADLIVANLTLDVICGLLETTRLKDRKRLLLSGVLSAQLPRLLDVLERFSFRLETKRCDSAWCGLLVSKAGDSPS